MDTPEIILRRDYSEDFDAKRKNRILVSHHKYGWMSDTYPDLAQAVISLRARLELYEQDGNLEHLVDVANFAMIEFMYPSHPNAHFRATDSGESPGLAGGISYKQMCEQMD